MELADLVALIDTREVEMLQNKRRTLLEAAE
jgi:hypothetical protein